MSSDRKQDVVTKTVENERIQIGVLKPSVDESEEPSVSEDDEDADEASDESEKSGDTDISDYFAPGEGVKYCDERVCLSVCLSVAHISRRSHFQTSQNFSYVLTVVVMLPSVL